jgi:hypothetical protein
VPSVGTIRSQEFMLVRIEEAARIRILPFARGCLLETNKDNTMTIRIAIIAAFASTLVLTATICGNAN